MRIIFTAFSILLLFSSAHAKTDINTLRNSLKESKTTLDKALTNVRGTCLGFSDDLQQLKTLAGIGTGVSAGGVVGAGAAGVAGIIKNTSDETAMSFNASQLWEQLNKNDKNSSNHKKLSTEQAKEFDTWFDKLNPTQENHETNIANTKQQLRQMTEAGQKSEKMGNLRTGTLAASAVLNIAGATVSGIDIKKNATITERISECVNATQELRKALTQVKMDKSAYDTEQKSSTPDTPNAENDIITDTELSTVQNIVSACSGWSTVDLSKIENRAKGAMTSNIIGAITGTTGTITSAMSNTDANRLSGTNKEKNLNITSNVMTAGSAVAGIAATIFNATQISKIKHAAKVADECAGALK
jgi:hypothetical protein